jgi:hypothetical protein
VGRHHGEGLQNEDRLGLDGGDPPGERLAVLDACHGPPRDDVDAPVQAGLRPVGERLALRP